MKRFHTLARLCQTSVVAILVVCVTTWFSPALTAAELPVASAPAPPSTGDGALFTAFVPVLRHPRFARR